MLVPAATMDLRFNWLGGPTSTQQKVAAGRVYILDREYFGTQGALSTSTPGFVAQSTAIVNGEYVFDSAVTLQAQTHYWFYTAGERVDPWSDWEFDRASMRDVYPDGTAYSTGANLPYILFLGADFDPPFSDFNFELQGRRVQ